MELYELGNNPCLRAVNNGFYTRSVNNDVASYSRIFGILRDFNCGGPEIIDVHAVFDGIPSEINYVSAQLEIPDN